MNLDWRGKMTLHEKLALIESTLHDIHIDTASALTIQGVYREPEDFMLQELGTLIRLIKTEDFQFRFDFKSLDSVGKIHARLEGISSGNSGISPIKYDHWWFTMDMSIPETKVKYPAHGCYGMPDQDIGITSSMEDIELHIFNFKELDSISANLVPMPEESNEV